MSIQYQDHVVASNACRECGGHGTLWDFDLGGSKVRIPCPVCQPNPTPTCRECGGTGIVKFSTGGFLSDWIAVECRCRAA